MAVIVVLYKAILESIDAWHFDMLHSDLFLFDRDSNRNLHLIDRTIDEVAVSGDVLYFESPEYEPMIPWGKGENVVMMENGLFFGHGYGLGIASAEEVITVLNNHRKPGSTQSAFLSNRYVHPDFSYFALFQSRKWDFMISKVGEWIFIQ